MGDPREIFAAKIAAAQQAKAALERAKAQGVQCTRCGGSVMLPEDLAMPSFTCRFCGTVLMTAQYVPAEYLAGVGLRERLQAMHADVAIVSRRRDKAILIGAALISLVILLAVFVPILLSRP